MYRNYLKALYAHDHRVVPNWMAANILTQSQKITKPFLLSSCSEYLSFIFNDTCTYLMKEPVSQLTDDEEFLRQLSPDAVVAFLGRDDIAKKGGELQVSCATKSEGKMIITLCCHYQACRVRTLLKFVIWVVTFKKPFRIFQFTLVKLLSTGYLC